MRFPARRRWALFAALAILALAPAAATAHAASTDLLTGNCLGQRLGQPFLPWLDPGSYVLAGDGGFELGATGWTLSGGADVVRGNEPWHVRGNQDSHSLYLPAEAKAISPATCIGLLDPTARLFARSLGGTLDVQANVQIGLLSLLVPIGTVVAGDSFAPTQPLPLLGNLTTLLSGGTGSVELIFTAVGGAMQIDDVYIDPFKVN